MDSRSPLSVLGLLLTAIFLGVQCKTECSIEGDVEFVGLSVSHAGIVRVCVNGFWGTICAAQNDPWSEKNCQVACRKAGYSGARNPILQYTLLQSVKNVVANDPIHYSSVQCDGTETELSDCSFSDFTDNCNHNFDVAVTCKSDTASSGYTNGDVRLLGSRDDGKGVVEYYDIIYGWTGVCADSSTEWLDATTAATIVCRQLGYEGGTTYTEGDSNVVSALESLSVTDLSCDSSDVHLSDCTKTSVTGCNVAGGVECSRTSSEDFSVRLVGGTERSGVVEVAFNGRWGTACEDSDWSVEDATVVCRQLGFLTDTPPSIITSSSYPEFYVMPVTWLSEVVCDSTEPSLSECGYALPIGYANCPISGNRAVVNCGAPTPSDEGGLSGGAIAGIVIGSLVGVGALVALIHFWSQEKKKRAAAAIRRPPPAPSSTPAPPPPAPTVTITTVQTNTAATPTTTTNVETEWPEAELMNAAPPSYQVAVNYPTANSQQPHDQPEKTGPKPDFSVAYPLPTASAPPLGPAYPPPDAPPPPLGPVYPPYDAPPPPLGPAYPPPDAPPPPLGPAYPPPTQGYYDPAYPPPVGEAVFMSPLQ